MSISNPTTNPQNSNKNSVEVNITNFPGLLLDISVNDPAQIAGMPNNVTDVSNNSVQSFTDGVGNVISTASASEWFLQTALNGEVGLIVKSTAIDRVSLATPIQLSNKPTILIAAVHTSNNTTIYGVGDSPGNFQGINACINNVPYTSRNTANWKRSFNWGTSGGALKPSSPFNGALIVTVADNVAGDWRECGAAYNTPVQHEVQLSPNGNHGGNDWSGESMSLISLPFSNIPTALTSYLKSMRLIELNTALTDVELEQLALFVARNNFTLPEFMLGH